jgi:hypothetical protein
VGCLRAEVLDGVACCISYHCDLSVGRQGYSYGYGAPVSVQTVTYVADVMTRQCGAF